MQPSLVAGTVLLGVLACARGDPLAALDEEAAPTGTSGVLREEGETSSDAAPPWDRSEGEAGPTCDRQEVAPGTSPWQRRISGDDVLQVTSVAVDPSTGAVFVARAAGELLKLERSGGVAWRRPFGMRVATDGRGNPHTAGTFSGTVRLGEVTLTSAGGSDVYVARLDPDGAVSLAVSLGGPADESVSSIAVDPEGSVVASGAGLGTIKLDSAGRTLWQRPYFGQVAVDEAASIVLTGALSGAMAFGDTTLESAGGEDVFIAKVDGEGSTLFALAFGDAAPAQRGEAIAVAAGGGILVSGVIDGSVDFGGGPLGVHAGTCPSESWCEQAGFVVALDARGRHQWSRVHAPARSLPAIASDSQGNVLVSGASPGNAPPYRLPLLLRFDARGSEMPLAAPAGSGLPASGAGHGVAIDPCDDVIWALSMPASPGMDEETVVMKLAP